MFSQACVKNSVHRMGVYRSMHWGRHPQAGIPTCTGSDNPPSRYPSMHWGRHSPPLWAGIPACIGADTPQEGIPACTGADTTPAGIPACTGADTTPAGIPACTGADTPDGQCSGRYASYWNAFLLPLTPAWSSTAHHSISLFMKSSWHPNVFAAFSVI